MVRQQSENQRLKAFPLERRAEAASCGLGMGAEYQPAKRSVGSRRSVDGLLRDVNVPHPPTGRTVSQKSGHEERPVIGGGSL
jgi:hypothetical protein